MDNNSIIRTSVDDNSYKGESPISPPMTGEDNLHITHKQCSVHTTHTTLHKNEERKPIQIRMRKSVHKTVGGYIEKTMSYGVFYERAAILYMDVNPVDRTILVINGAESETTDLDQLMLIMECTQELEEMLIRLKRMISQGVKFQKKTLADLRKVFAKCRKVKNKSDDMETMIREAITLVGF